MSRTVEIDGQQVTVWTQEEVARERDAAAAAARRQAEGERDAARQELQVAQARVTELERAQASVTQERDAVQRTLAGVRVLAGHGLRADQAEQVLGMPLFREVDVSSAEAVQAAVEALRATFPSIFGPVQAGGEASGAGGAGSGSAGPGATGVGGSPAPAQGELDAEALGKLSMEAFNAYMDKVEGRRR